MVPEEDSIEVPSVGGRKPRIMARQVLGDVVQARAEEVCQMILTEAKKRAQDDFEEVLEKKKLPLDAVKRLEERFPHVRRATTPIPHSGYAGTAANYIMHLAHLAGVTFCLHRLLDPAPQLAPLNTLPQPQLANIGSPTVPATHYNQLLREVAS